MGTSDEEFSRENKSFSTSPSRFYFFGRYFIFIFLILLGVFSILFGPQIASQYELDIHQIYYTLPLGASILAFIYAEIPVWSIEYKLTEDKVIVEKGVFSKSFESVDYSHITDTIIDIKFRERFFSIGDISINTAGASNYEVILRGVKEPQKLQEIIQSHLRGGMELSDDSIHKLAHEIDKTSGGIFQEIKELRKELEEINNEKWEIRESFDNYEMDERQFEDKIRDLELEEEEINRKLDKLEKEARKQI